jgi:drug/metabolite transporter (DMT)-like permease
VTPDLPIAALALVLASALLHATWNVLLARVPRGLDATAVGLAIGLVAWTPLALVRWRVEAAVWPYVLASAALELAYFAALTRAYAIAPAHAVYPVARGLAPVVLLAGVVTGGARPGVVAGLGVLAISGGVLLTARSRADRRSVLAAVPVALCIAGYTYVDAVGLRHADPAPYLWLVMLPTCVALLAQRVARGGLPALRAQIRPATLAFGVGVYGAYGLILTALAIVSVAQVPAVAALRETSILFVVGLAWLAARRDPARAPTVVTAAGAVLMLGGITALALR